MQGTKLVLPGGAGLVGQNLVARLASDGAADIVVLDKHAENLRVLAALHPEVVTVHADLAERGRWEEHFAGASAVVMLQAQIGGKDEALFVRNNLRATENVLLAMRTHGVSYLVHVSSSVVESTADDAYTRTKRAQEVLVRDGGVDSVILRPTLMFGWFDRKHLGWLFRFMRRVPIFPIPGHGRYVRQPLYVGDFCSVILGCLATRPRGETLNISGIERIFYVDMIRSIRRAARARAAIVHVPCAIFHALLRTWALFDRDPPFTSDQLRALTAGDEFDVGDWPSRFGVVPTPFAEAVRETFTHPAYSDVVLAF